MKNKKKLLYLALPIAGVLFYLAYLYRSSIDMVYSDYIRLINSYLPDVWNPEKFFVADLLTRIPANFLERGINVQLFGYSVAFDRMMGVLCFGLSAAVIGVYSKKRRLGPGWYTVLMAVMFSLNKWEMLYNGTGWAHFLAFACFFFHYLVLDQVYGKKSSPVNKTRLGLLYGLPAVITIGVAGPYCAIYTVTLILAYLFVFIRNQWILREDRAKLQEPGRCSEKDGPIGIFDARLCAISGKQTAALCLAAAAPFLLYLWSNSQAVYEYSGAVETPLLTAFFQEPKFFIKFFLKSFASMVFGVELINRKLGWIPGKVWCALGLLVLLAYFLALWMNFHYRISEKTILPLMLLASGGMNHLMVLVSRYIFMPNDGYGMSSRYALQYQVGILGILLTFALAAKGGWRRETEGGRDGGAPGGQPAGHAKASGAPGGQPTGHAKANGAPGGQPTGRAKASGAPAGGIRALALALSAMFLLGNLWTTAEEFSFGKHRKNHNLEVKEILLNYENETDEALRAALEFRKPGCREALAILDENNWNIFRE